VSETNQSIDKKEHNDIIAAKSVVTLTDFSKLVLHFSEIAGKNTATPGIATTATALVANLYLLNAKIRDKKQITLSDVTAVLDGIVSLSGDLALRAPTPQTKALGVTLKALSTYITYTGLAFGDTVLIEEKTQIATAGKKAYQQIGTLTGTRADQFAMQQTGNSVRFTNTPATGGEAVGYLLTHRNDEQTIATRLNNRLEAVEGFELRTVQHGETLTGIARKNGYTVQQLLDWNTQITNANKIFSGESIRIPLTVRNGNAQHAPRGTTVGPNQFLVDRSFRSADIIASMTGTTLAALRAKNPKIRLSVPMR